MGLLLQSPEATLAHLREPASLQRLTP